MSLLSVTRRGEGRPFVWLHGFTQTRDSAQQFRTILAESLELRTLDLPGHGTAARTSASLEESADLVADAIGDEPVDVGGYSLGGRVALHLALAHPRVVRRLVLVGATRGIPDEAGRAERRASDEALAERLLATGVERFLDEWLAGPLFASLAPDARERAARSTDADGLASSLRRAGTGTQSWLGERLATVRAPVLAIAGEHDAKFSLEARAIADAVVDGTVFLVPGAGHAAHLEQPAVTARRVVEFLV
ncbi:MAG: alpha/beta fold hydrolase [Acidobacteriota bacterium]|nr:alpha/beta fold hydrolase [Acidobacteriota bacterium]